MLAQNKGKLQKNITNMTYFNRMYFKIKNTEYNFQKIKDCKIFWRICTEYRYKY